MKCHIRTRLIESFPTIIRTWWCGEEKLHFTPVHSLCQLKRDEGLFSLLGRVVEFRPRYRQIPGRGFFFGGGPKPGCSDGLCTGTIESHNFFVLGPILVKFHIQTRLIETFRTIFRTWWCGEEKLHFTPFHTLHQLKRDEALIPPLRRVVAFPAKYG